MRKRTRLGILTVALLAAIALLVVLLRPPAPDGERSTEERGSSPGPGEEVAEAPGAVAPVEAPDESPSPEPGADARPGTPDPKKGTVHGRLTFDDGTPVRGGRVWLWGSNHVVATTDDDGGYRIEGAWTGRHFRDLMLGPDEAAVAVGRVTLRAGGEVELDAVVARGVDFDLLVVASEDGKPLAGVWAMLDPRPPAPGVSAAGKTDAEGRIRWRHLPARGWSLRIDHDGRRAHREDLDLTSGAGVRSHRIALEESLPLVLRVRPPPAKVGASINLGFLPLPFDEEGPQYQLVGRLDAAGVYRGEAPPPGRYDVLLVIEGFGNQKMDPIEVVPRSGVEIVANLPSGATVSGLLLRSDGEPVDGARIRLWPRPGGPLRSERRAACAADGTFRVTRVVPGAYELRVEIGALTLAGLVPDLRVPEQGLAGLRIVLPRGGTIRARTDAKGSMAGRPFHVDVERFDEERWIWRAGAGGRAGEIAVVSHLEPGRWRVSGRGAGLHDGWTEPVEVEISGPGSDVEVTLRFRPAPTVALSVRRASGAAAKGSWDIFVQPVDSKGPIHIAPVSIDDDGKGSLRLARPGRYRLHFLRKGGGKQHATVEVESPPDGVAAPIRVTLED